jgi:hypothetical protein
MTLSITIAELRVAHACDLDDRIATLAAHLGRTPADDEPIPLATWAEVTPDVDDLMWGLRCCWDRGGRAVGVEVACRAAERAMTHARPKKMSMMRAAVDAARGCVAGKVTQEACQDAARAAFPSVAYAAARAACATYANTAANAAFDAANDASASERAAQLADLLALVATASRQVPDTALTRP